MTNIIPIKEHILIAAVVVTHNRIDLLKKCIRSLLSQSFDKKLIVIVVDNMSSDNTSEYCSKINDERFYYYNSGHNLGGAGGFNYGIKRAHELGCDYVWLMDDDSVAKSDALEKIIISRSFKCNNLGFISSKVLWKDGSVFPMNRPKQSLTRWLKDTEKNNQKILMGGFVGFFVPMKVILDVGLPIADFKIYSDDWEYSIRISKKYQAYYVSDSIIYHLKESKEGADISKWKDSDLSRFTYMYRNGFFTFKQLGITGMVHAFLRAFYHVFKVIFSSSNNKKLKVSIIIRSTFNGLHYHPKIEYLQKEQ